MRASCAQMGMWCPTVWMKLMQPRFNLKFYELFQHPAKKTMLRYAEILKLKPLSFSTAAALLLLLVSRLTSKSTCRQQNTMPLKDEQVLEFHGKMPNVTSETVEKTLLLLLATCYLCTKSSWTQAPKAAGCSATATCEPPHHQKHLPTAKHHATEGRPSPRIARKDA